jgi:hypothetical protein
MLTWFTQYKNGERHDYVPKKYDISHIDGEQLDILALRDPNAEIPTLVIHFDDPRKRPIYVRRTEPPGRRSFATICHIVGWQMKIGGENIQSISYVFETQGRIIGIDQEDKDGKVTRVPIRKDLVWVENAGKFDRERNEGWFDPPNPQQLNVIGSNVKHG